MRVSTISSRTCGLLFGLLVLAFIITYFPVWRNLIAAWYGSEDYSHGFLIIPIAGYIGWQKREVLKNAAIESNWWGLGMVLVSLFLYLVGYYGEIYTVSSVSLVLFLGSALFFLFGFQVFRHMLVPLFLLLFMIPIPSQVYSTLTIPLQLFVSQAGAALTELLGIPIYREGNVLHLADRTLQVVQACSGLRSMLSLIALGAAFGYLTLKSNLLRIILLLSGVPAAIVVNIIRVLLMVAVLYYFRYDLTAGSLHTVFGVFIFLLSLAIIAFIQRGISIWDRSTARK
jgi:exosortase A